MLTLNYQNNVRHRKTLLYHSFWAVRHSTSTKTHAQIKWNTLLEITITFLIHFSRTSRELGKAMDPTLGSGDTQFQAKILMVRPNWAWFAAKAYQKNTAITHLPYPNSSKLLMISLQVSDFLLLDIMACTKHLMCTGS